MKKYSTMVILFFYVISYSQHAKENNSTYAFTKQTGFSLQNDKMRDRIPFRLVNNLPIIDVEINGAKLSFILDTGVKSTILFSLEAADSVQLRNTSPVQLQGLGSEGALEALKSLNNKVKVGEAIDKDHTLYIIFDSSLNFSPRMGIPIHGILGNDFFQNFIVKIDYLNEIVTIYDNQRYSLKPCKECEDLPLNFVGNKPYISLKIISEDKLEEVKLLVDSGSSDVLWLFEDYDFIKESPKNYFRDFLGLGLSGNIYGNRTRIPELILGKYHLKEVNASFPEEDAIIRARNYVERDGSVGGGFLKKFTVFFDYRNKLVRFKKNRNFKLPFNYNMSGLTLEHDGMEFVKQGLQNSDSSNKSYKKESFMGNRSVPAEVHFSLAPKYVVVDVREDSPAALAGIVIGDEIISINDKFSYEYKLYQLIELFSSEEGKRITMEVKRGGGIKKVRFRLRKVF